MKTTMYRVFALVLVLALALSMSACGSKKPTETTGTNETTGSEETTGTSAETKALSYFSLSCGDTAETTVYLSAYVVDETTAFVEYRGEVRKEGNVDAATLETIAAEFAKSGLAELAGQDAYEEGEAAASMYVEYTDGTSVTVGFSGTIPETYKTGFAAMDTCFQDLTANMEEYVPQASVMGEVDADRLAAMQEILTSEIPGLEGLAITEIPMGEDFGFSAGLSSTDGIVGGSLCSAQMMTTAYSFVIVTVEDESKIDTVRADLEENMDFGKWVCVRPTDAVIAQKGNMVLCVMGADEMFTATKAGIEAAGWENLATFKDNAQ